MNDARSPIIFDSIPKKYIGNVYKTNEGYYIKIIEYQTNKNVKYKFLDNFGYIDSSTLQNILKGQIKNPFHQNEVGGYLGVGPYKTKEYTWLNNIWYGLLYRVAGKKTDNIKDHYDHLCFDPEWYNYSKFAEWYLSIYKNPGINYNINNTILYPYYSQFTNGRKCYSKYTCVLLPTDIFNYDNKICEDYYNKGAIDLDTYNVIKRFYLKDPNYKDYITTRFDSFRYMNLIYF